MCIWYWCLTRLAGASFYSSMAAHVQRKAPLFLWIAAARQPAAVRGHRQGCTDRVGTTSQPPPLHFFPLAPTLFTFCSRHSQDEWLKALAKEKKNLRFFSVRFLLHLASSSAFLAKSRSQFFLLLAACRLLVPRSRPLTHLHHYSSGT